MAPGNVLSTGECNANGIVHDFALSWQYRKSALGVEGLLFFRESSLRPLHLSL